MHALADYGWTQGALQLRVTPGIATLKHDGWTYDAEAETLPGAAVDTGFLRERDIAAAFATFTALPATDRDALLALAVSSSVQAALPEDKAGVDYTTDWAALAKATARLSALANPELRRIWTPTAENFLGRVSKAVLLDIVEATLGAADARLLMGAKKGELVRAHARRLQRRRCACEARRRPARAARRLDPRSHREMRHGETGRRRFGRRRGGDSRQGRQSR
jgi:hypothetical protein